MEIPEEVKKEARYLIEEYGDSFEYLGTYQGQKVFLFKFPENIDTGFPFVYWYKNGMVFEETGFDALNTIELFTKD